MVRIAQVMLVASMAKLLLLIVSEVAWMASEGGAVVLPFIVSGGASAGLHDFPPEALKKPAFVSEQDWDLLSNKEASPEAIAGAVSTILDTFRQARLQALQAHMVAVDRWQAATKTLRMAKACMDTMQRGAFRVEDVVGVADATACIEEEFDAVAHNWKPRQTGRANRRSIDAMDKLEAPRGLDEGVRAPEVSREARAKATPKKEAPPPPRETNEVAGTAKALLGDIESSQAKMKARVEELHNQVNSATAKIQAVERGRQARKVLRAGAKAAVAAAAIAQASQAEGPSKPP